MEKTIKVTNIDWDIDIDDFEFDELDMQDLTKKELQDYLNLPTEEEIVVPEDDEDEDYIGDYLSDKYGYCVNSFNIAN